jgi:hypothetical protein
MDFVFNLNDALHPFSDVFRDVFILLAIQQPGEGDNALLTVYLDMSSMEVLMLEEAIIDFFNNAPIGSCRIAVIHHYSLSIPLILVLSLVGQYS